MGRDQRSIALGTEPFDDGVERQDDCPEGYDWYKQTVSLDGTTERTVYRIANRRYETMVIKRYSEATDTEYQSTSYENAPAQLDYAMLLNEVQVEPDDDCYESPWENCDGWDHTVVSFENWTRGFDSPLSYDELREHFKDIHGYVRHSEYVCDAGDSIIRLDEDFDDIRRGEGKDLWNHYRRNGCSKQVTREIIASIRRSRIKQLYTWFTEGWGWWYVAVDYEGYHESCGGIDNEDDANDSCRAEVLSELIWSLENKEGYLIVNAPERPVRRYGGYDSPEKCRASLKDQMSRYSVIGHAEKN